MKYPDFIIIGAEKCGTTALWYNLDKHPDISMATKTIESVEMNFWAGPCWKKGVDWYQNKFDSTTKLAGEKSILYINNKLSMRKMHNHIPNVKLILCVRNPVDRAYSQFQMNRRHNVNMNFDMNLFRVRYDRNGQYYENLKKNVFPYYREDQLHICVCERMKNNPTKEMKKLFEFLGVDDLNLPSKEIDPILRRHRTRQEDIVLSRSENFYRVWNRHKDKLEGNLRQVLLDYYRPHNRKLFNFMGYEVKEWNK